MQIFIGAPYRKLKYSEHLLSWFIFSLKAFKPVQGQRYLHDIKSLYTHLCTSSVASCLKSSSCDHESMVNLDVEKYKGEEWHHS